MTIILRLVVLNQDDAQVEQWLEKYDFNNLICYGHKNLTPEGARYVYFSDVVYDNTGISAKFETSWGHVHIAVCIIW